LCPNNFVFGSYFLCSKFIVLILCEVNTVYQRFPNFFQVQTTFISQNVLRTTLLLSALKANCLRFSTTVCDTQFTLILFFLSFFGIMFNPRGPQGQNLRTTWSADHSLGNAAVYVYVLCREHRTKSSTKIGNNLLKVWHNLNILEPH
jgi:hypothetical protein